MKKLFASVALLVLTATGVAADGTRAAYGGSSLPAVSGVNGKFEAFGGAYGDEALGAVAGSISFPLDRRFGVQIDTLGGSLDGDSIWGVGGHVFWRDPAHGLFGVYGDFVRWNNLGGNEVARVAAESEVYLGRLSLEGMAGIEYGELDNRMFSRTNVAYYPHDDLRVFVGHRYLGGENAFAVGTEWQVARRGVALFTEASFSRDDAGTAILGGVRIYLGSGDKSLIRRHREDDPSNDLKNASQSLTGNLDGCTKKVTVQAKGQAVPAGPCGGAPP